MQHTSFKILIKPHPQTCKQSCTTPGAERRVAAPSHNLYTRQLILHPNFASSLAIALPVQVAGLWPSLYTTQVHSSSALMETADAADSRKPHGACEMHRECKHDCPATNTAAAGQGAPTATSSTKQLTYKNGFTSHNCTASCAAAVRAC